MFIRLRRIRRIYEPSANYVKNKERARVLVHQRVFHFNKIYNFEFGRIAIKDQRRVWGSCSAKGNLNFNYRLVFLPQGLSDYVIVHELCHLKELNHSKNFWELVKIAVPDHKDIRRKLKEYRFSANNISLDLS